MTIDEVVKRLDDKYPFDAMATMIMYWLEELKWYREQDLVKREDAVKTVTSIKCYAHIQGFRDTECEGTNCVVCNMKHIPKAKPPKE